MALLNAVMVARKRALTSLLYRLGVPGMLILWLMIKICPVSWLFSLKLEEVTPAPAVDPR